MHDRCQVVRSLAHGIAPDDRSGDKRADIPLAQFQRGGKLSDDSAGCRSSIRRDELRRALVDTKTGASLRPLSELACAVIQSQPRIGDLVFAPADPARRGEYDNAMRRIVDLNATT